MSRIPSGASPAWVAAGAVFSGGSTYVLLVITARAVGPEAYGHFSLFWAAIVIASLGLFLPVEQVLARRVAHGRGLAVSVTDLARHGLARSGWLAAAAVAVHTGILLGPRDQSAAPVDPWLIGAFAVGALGFVAQFTARGVLAGLHQLRSYSAVIAIDAGARAVAAVALALAGVTAVAPYAVAVGASSLLCGAAGLLLVRHALGRSGATAAHGAVGTHPDPGAARIGRRELAGLVVAALCMQGLLNSAVVVAGIAGAGREAVLAGQLLAVITLARIPVFVFQSAQAAYVSRIAAGVHRGQGAAVTRLLTRLAAAVIGVGALTVAVAAAAGPPIIHVVFGPEYEITRGAATVVAAGVALYLVASVSNDVAIAAAAHRLVLPAWTLGALAAVACAVAIPDLVLRSALPLAVGSAVAIVVLLPSVVARTRAVAPRW